MGEYCVWRDRCGSVRGTVYPWVRPPKWFDVLQARHHKLDKQVDRSKYCRQRKINWHLRGHGQDHVTRFLHLGPSIISGMDENTHFEFGMDGGGAHKMVVGDNVAVLRPTVL